MKPLFNLSAPALETIPRHSEVIVLSKYKKEKKKKKKKKKKRLSNYSKAQLPQESITLVYIEDIFF